MPKSQLAIKRFEGGLHTNADPRDIADNEFSALKGVDVDSLGRIVMMGDYANHSAIDATDTKFKAGYGILSFSSDYDDAGGIVSTNYLALTDGSYVRIWDDGGGNTSNDAWDAMTNLEASTVAIKGFALGESTTAISDLDVASGTATVTTSSVHGLKTGDLVYINASNNTYDAYVTVLASGLTTTVFKYTTTESDVTNLTGTVTGNVLDVEASMYAPDGGLRVCDGNFTNFLNVPKLLNYIPPKTYGGPGTTAFPTIGAQAFVGFGASVGGTTQDGWVVNNASIETGVTSSNLKMINLGGKTKGNIEGDSVGNDIIVSINPDPGNNVVIDHRPAGSGGGIDHGAIDVNYNYYNGMTCSFFGPGESIYGVVSDYNYDTATNQSTFSIWTGPEGDVTPAAAIAASAETDVTAWSFQVGQSDGYLWEAQFSEAAHDQKCRHVISDDWGVTLSFDEGATGSGTWMPAESPNVRYKFYHSTVFDGNQESNPALFTMYPTKQSAGETAHASVDEIWFRDGTSEIGTDSDDGGTSDADSIGTPSVDIAVSFGLLVRMRSDNTAVGAGKNFTLGSLNYDTTAQDTVSAVGTYNFLDENQRVTGGRIYWASSEDGYSNLYLLIDYDLEKGAKPYGSSAGAGASGFSPWISWVYPVASNPVVRPQWSAGESTWDDPPTLLTYEDINLYSHDTKLNAKWKTAVVTNSRTYAANIKRQEKSTFNGGGTWHQSATPTDDPEYQDRIIRSAERRFDTFPEENAFLLGASNDGDSIIKLETFADRLFVFGKYKLKIVNIQNDTFVLESENPFMGLDGGHPAQSIATDIGIAWINSQGVYFYNGEQIQSLSEKIKNMWIGQDKHVGDTDLDAFWFSGEGGDLLDIPAITYDPKSKKLICIKTITGAGSDKEHILVYSFITNAWTYKEHALTNNTEKRFTIYKNELIFDNESRIQTWSDTPSSEHLSLLLYTKDIDFGAPGVRKKIYKVYVTYTTHEAGDNDTKVLVKYGVNGVSPPLETFKNGTNFLTNELGATTSIDLHVAELKPTTSATANNIYSFQLAFSAGGTVPAKFEINDITIIYRVKSIK